jgi:hypothetical protein
VIKTRYDFHYFPTILVCDRAPVRLNAPRFVTPASDQKPVKCLLATRSLQTDVLSSKVNSVLQRTEGTLRPIRASPSPVVRPG